MSKNAERTGQITLDEIRALLKGRCAPELAISYIKAIPHANWDSSSLKGGRDQVELLIEIGQEGSRLAASTREQFEARLLLIRKYLKELKRYFEDGYDDMRYVDCKEAFIMIMGFFGSDRSYSEDLPNEDKKLLADTFKEIYRKDRSGKFGDLGKCGYTKDYVVRGLLFCQEYSFIQYNNMFSVVPFAWERFVVRYCQKPKTTARFDGSDWVFLEDPVWKEYILQKEYYLFDVDKPSIFYLNYLRQIRSQIEADIELIENFSTVLLWEEVEPYEIANLLAVFSLKAKKLLELTSC